MPVQKKPFVSDKLARRRKAEARAKRLIGFILLTLVLGAAGYLTFGNRFQIKSVLVTGTKAVSADDVKASTETIIAGRKIIIPNRNMFLYPKNAIKTALSQAFPRLDAISVEIKNRELVVLVTEREPAYIWCGSAIPATRQESFAATCYFVDAKGFIFSESPQFSDDVYPKIYTTLERDVEPIGQHAIDPTILFRSALFAKEITTPLFKPTAFSVTTEGDALIFLYRDGDMLPEIRYNPEYDSLVSVAGFKTAISTEPLKSKIAKNFSTLEYIDVRFPNKVFYKFHDETSVEQGDKPKTP